MKFHLHQDRAGNQFYFELVSEEGLLLLTSQVYADRDGCIEGIQGAVEGLLNEDRFDSRAEADGFFFVLRTADEQELARSPSFGSRPEVAEAIASITSEAANTREYEVTVTPIRKTYTALVDRYDFSQRSTSGQPGFEWFWSDKNRRYYFHFNDAQGQAFLYSWAFSTIARCKERIRSVIKNASVATRYERKEQDGHYFFILKARNGREIARSRLFVAAEGMEMALAYLSSHAAEYAAQFAKPKRTGAETGTGRYNLSRRSTSGMVGFEAFRSDVDARYYFHFNDKNGQGLLYSRAYATRTSRDGGLRAVIKNAGSEARYETREEEGRYYFVLRAGNKRELARSTYFVSAAEMAAAIAFLRATVPGYANAYGVTLGAAGTSQAETFTLFVNRAGAFGAGAATAAPAVAATTAAAASSTATTPRAATAPPRSANGDGRARRWLLRLSPVLLVFLLLFVFRGFDGGEGGGADTETLTEGSEQREPLAGVVEVTEGDDTTSGAGGGTETSSGVAGGETPSADTGGGETSSAAARDETLAAAGDAETPSAQATGETPSAGTGAGETPSEAVPSDETPAGEVKRETPSADPAVAEARAAGQERPVNQGQPADRAQRAAEDARAVERQPVARQTPVDDQTPAEESPSQPEQEAGPARFDHSQESWTIVVASYAEQAAAAAAVAQYREKLGGHLVDVIEETGGGQMHYRVVVGQFQTLQATHEGQRGLGNVLPAGAWQLHVTAVTDDASDEIEGVETPSGAPKSRASGGADAAALGFAAGTMEAQMADALSDPNSRLPGMFTMEKVKFPFNSARLNQGAYQQVINLAKLLNTYPDVRIDIYGHIDETETEIYVGPYADDGPITLSALRARCIYRKLIERGVAAERLGFQGFGATKPLASANTARGRQQNRRTEIVVSRR